MYRNAASRLRAFKMLMGGGGSFSAGGPGKGMYSRLSILENSTGQTCLPNNALPILFGNLGVKLRLVQAKPDPGAMNLRNFLHTSAPKEFEKEGDTRSFQMQSDTEHLKTDSNTGPSGMLRKSITNEMERGTRNTGQFERSWNNKPPGRNFGSFELQRDSSPFEMDQNARPTEMFRNTSTNQMGLNVGSTAMNSRPSGMGWDSRSSESSVRLSEMSRDTRSMNFVRGLIEDNGGDNFGARQQSNYNVEQNADIVHIKLKRNNAFVTVTDSKGNKKVGASAGLLSTMKGGPQVSRYSAEATAEHVGRLARNMGLKSVVVKLNGFVHFKKKKQAVLSFRDGFTNSRSDQNPIVYIEDTTRRAHNGCRLRKKRRV